MKRKAGWRARPRWRMTRGAEIAIGPGKADLLEAIGRTGSISAAAARMGMSYRRAWLLVEAMNRCFVRPLVSTSTWRGKGATLTADGKTALRLYRRLETLSVAAARSPLLDLKRLLKRAGSPRGHG